MEITIKNQQKRIPLNPAPITKITQKILTLEGITQGFLSLVFVTDKKIQLLNKQFLNRDYATDVLAFDFKDTPKKKTSRRSKTKTLEGEIVISTGMAAKNSRIYQTTPKEEVFLYIIHGILHLLGYDDHKPGDVKKMRQKEQELLARIKPLIK